MIFRCIYTTVLTLAFCPMLFIEDSVIRIITIVGIILIWLITLSYKDPSYYLKAESRYMIDGKQCVVVKNPIQCNDFTHLQNHIVSIDGENYLVIGVERNTKMPPFWEGELIGLMVEKIKT